MNQISFQSESYGKVPFPSGNCGGKARPPVAAAQAASAVKMEDGSGRRTAARRLAAVCRHQQVDPVQHAGSLISFLCASSSNQEVNLPPPCQPSVGLVFLIAFTMILTVFYLFFT